MASGLAIDSSDMDILVTGVFPNYEDVDRGQIIDQMARLHHQLKNLTCLQTNTFIETATVPVIKLVT
jgi:DNA polymerase sigma